MLDKIRNIGIIAHIDAGKTTLTERILFYTGKEHKIGEVDDGTATMDWMEEEQKRGITITSAATTCYWSLRTAPKDKFRINIIDTPGHVDFTAEVERSLRVLDSAVVVFCGVGGVEAQSETVWHQADRYRIPRLVFINKLDRVGSNFPRVITDIEQKLKVKTLPLTIPIGTETGFKGVIDLVQMKALYFDEASQGAQIEVTELPPDYTDTAKKQHDKMIARLAEEVDWLVEPYLKGESIDPATLYKAIREATLKYKLIPVFAGSAVKNMGVQPLLDAVCSYLPSPLDLPAVEGKDPETDKVSQRKNQPDEYFSGLVFKTMTDRHGELAYFRIYSGKIKAGAMAYNPRIDKKERITKLFLLHADKREPIEEAQAGEIIGIVGLKDTFTGDTLCDKNHPIVYEQMNFPETVVSMSLEPKSSADRDKLMDVLAKMAKDDPTFQQKEDTETGQIIVSGMGELHLEVIQHRLVSDFNLGVKASDPRVAYKEMITQPAQGEGEFIRKVGEKEHYGRVILQLEPDKQDLHPKIETKIGKEIIPHQFIPAIEEGIKGSFISGLVAGYPLIYLKVIVTGGGYKPNAASEVAYNSAAMLAMQDALKKSGCVILEPIMKFEITLADDYLGDVINDLGKRRGEIQEIITFGQTRVIKGIVPIAETFGYASILRSITQGRSSYSLELHDYRSVPEDIKNRLGW